MSGGETGDGDGDGRARGEGEGEGDPDAEEGAFRYTTELDVRLRDLDPMGHVNNGVYATYLEQAREHYFRDVIDKGLLDDLNTVTAKLTLEYSRPVPAETDRVVVAVRTANVGEKSLRLAYEVRVDDGVAATGETVQVAYDVANEAATAVPEAWRRDIDEFEQP